ncbi:MAG: hypothetical protein PUC33_03105 [Oscillospiraceae bacterium]|nr:hypothetical protein [Oscillospiraceae bacterium]
MLFQDERIINKSFAQAFLKACGVKGQSPLSRFAKREMPLTKNNLCAGRQKKKYSPSAGREERGKMQGIFLVPWETLAGGFPVKRADASL